MEKEGKIDTIIGRNTTIQGEIKISGSIKVDGSVEGNIIAKDSIYCGSTGFIKGNINCKSGVLGGKVEGNINAEEVLEFQSGAQMYGDIVCKGLIIQSGVFFEGNCRMGQKIKEKE